MALDNIEEFFIGDYVYVIAFDGSSTRNGQIKDKFMGVALGKPGYVYMVEMPSGDIVETYEGFMSYTI